MPNVRALGIAVALSAPAVGAQDAVRDSAPDVARPGDTAQLRAAVRDERGRRIDCDARVAGVVADTVVLENVGRWSPCPRRAYAPEEIAFLRVQRGHRGSRLAHAGLGLVIGAAVGGVAGWALAGGTCDECTSGGDIELVVLTFLGLVGGGGTGAIVGALLPAGPRWVTIPAGTPVRVAGLQLRPGVRVGMAGR